ncbi:ABC transporter permease [Patulibacter sp. NPDC049589]|uniref:ABC transporter permease n=1 Tax=Patulibacter sp. NPDC049589 TaxID=3154731 RepID=UPI0034231837
MSATDVPSVGPMGAPDGPSSARPGSRELIQSVSLRYGVVIALVLMIVAFCVARPDSFATVSNLQAILAQAAPAMILAVGLTTVLVMQDFDLSFGATTNLAMGLVIAMIVKSGVPWVPALLVGLAAGVAVGLANGFLIARLGAASFIITLAMSTVVVGVEFAVTDQQNIIAELPAAFTSIGQNAPILGLSNVFWIAVIVCAIGWFALDKTESGRFMYAIGGNSEAARLAGVPILRLRLIGFAAVGFTAAIAGVLLASQSGSYAPGVGSAYLLPTYAAVFLGSAAFRPGQFTIPGAIVGVLFLQVINTGLSMLNLDTFVINLVQGAILIAAVLLSRLGQRTA